MGVGIYVEDENKFFFNNVIVGRTAKAKFKLMNNNKVFTFIRIFSIELILLCEQLSLDTS